MIKLFASDLDGTLLNDKKEVSTNTKEAIKRVLKQNKRFVITTGRPYGKYVINLKKELNLNDEYIIVFNGAMIYKNDQLVYSCGLNNKDVKDLEIFANNFNVFTHIFTDDNVIHIKENNQYSSYVKETNKSKVIYGDYNLTNLPIKFSIVSTKEEIEKVIKNIPSNFKERFNIFRSYDFLLEFVNKNVDKSNAIKKLIEMLNLNKDEVMTFGDEENDFNMVKDFYGVTPINGRDKLKEVAKIVCDSNNLDGVSKTILEYLEKDD